MAVSPVGRRGLSSGGRLWSCHPPRPEPGTRLHRQRVSRPVEWPGGQRGPSLFSQAKPGFPLCSQIWSHLPLKFSEISVSLTKLSLMDSHDYLSPVPSASCLWPVMGSGLGSERHQTGPVGPRTIAQLEVGELRGWEQGEDLCQGHQPPSTYSLTQSSQEPREQPGYLSQRRTVRLGEALSRPGQQGLSVPSQAGPGWYFIGAPGSQGGGSFQSGPGRGTQGMEQQQEL